jgi:integrase/recombinase XerD
LKSKTVKEYGGDLKHFIGWFEEIIPFHIEDVATTPTITWYGDIYKKK